MKDPVDRFVRAAARRNAYALLVVQFATLHLVVVVVVVVVVGGGGLALLTLYQPMSGRDFLILLLTSQAFVVADNLISMQVVRTMWRPVRAWTDGQRDAQMTVAGWRAGHAADPVHTPDAALSAAVRDGALLRVRDLEAGTGGVLLPDHAAGRLRGPGLRRDRALLRHR
jgi:hypothetical protein